MGFCDLTVFIESEGRKGKEQRVKERAAGAGAATRSRRPSWLRRRSAVEAVVEESRLRSCRVAERHEFISRCVSARWKVRSATLSKRSSTKAISRSLRCLRVLLDQSKTTKRKMCSIGNSCLLAEGASICSVAAAGQCKSVRVCVYVYMHA